ncbi:hypothetical protein [Chamaesiphon sp. VAR_48_metabat_403]|nr:hypothetical protein [Chamaesiphon sp. VAR_48_metabat_403]
MLALNIPYFDAFIQMVQGNAVSPISIHAKPNRSILISDRTYNL